jgi:membrane-bound serine protease (ClpP class)
VLAVVLTRMVIKSKTWHRIVLDTEEKKEAGFHVSADSLTSLMGRQGVAVTKLRPAGIALINNEKIDVMAEGNLIEKDQPIEVIKVEGNRVVVREIQDNL